MSFPARWSAFPASSVPGGPKLAEAIYGIDPHVTGEVRIAGRPAPRRTPQLCQAMGLVLRAGGPARPRHLPDAAQRPDGHGRRSCPSAVPASCGRIRRSALTQVFVERLRIKLSSAMQVARTLSGGNQQKVVLAKMLAPGPRVIILDEPTRGIDARARQDVYRIIRELTADGVGVVVISSEVGEIAEVSDRVMVMKRGRLVAAARPA